MIRIGDFARLARVSVRALRHYEAKGLLSPAHVDANSRYRYYDAQQIAALERVLLLKDIGLPLATIRDLLATPSAEFRAAIARHRTFLARQIEDQKRMLARVSALEAWLGNERGKIGAGDIHATASSIGSEVTGGLVRTKSFPPMRTLCTRAWVIPSSNALQEMFEETARRAKRSRTDQAPLLLLHNAPTSIRRLDAEVCIPVSGSCRLAGVRELDPEPLAASITYRGPYAGADDLYSRMREWLSRQKLVLAKRPIREIYHRFGANQQGYTLPSHRLSRSAKDFITELAIPVSEKR